MTTVAPQWEGTETLYAGWQVCFAVWSPAFSQKIDKCISSSIFRQNGAKCIVLILLFSALWLFESVGVLSIPVNCRITPARVRSLSYLSTCQCNDETCLLLQRTKHVYQQEFTQVFARFLFRNCDIKRKPPCIGGMELVSLSCNRVFISAECVGRGWCKIATATKWYQFHTTDKCGFLFMPWITDQSHLCDTQNL